MSVAECVVRGVSLWDFDRSYEWDKGWDTEVFSGGPGLTTAGAGDNRTNTGISDTPPFYL